jgi:hypothetical protein
MNVEIFTTDNFKARAKPLLKKFPSLSKELFALEKSLTENPFQGTNLGNNLFKLRLASRSKGKGKSGGFRIIHLVISEISPAHYSLYLLTIYDKSEKSTLAPKELQELMKDFT